MTTGASALSVIHHQGQPYISVSDLAGALSHMASSLAEGSEQRKPLTMLLNVFEGDVGWRRWVRGAQATGRAPLPVVPGPVVALEALGQDEPVTVEVFSAPGGEWVPVDRPDGSTMLVPWEPRLDGAGNVRVDTHRCRADGSPS